MHSLNQQTVNKKVKMMLRTMAVPIADISYGKQMRSGVFSVKSPSEKATSVLTQLVARLSKLYPTVPYGKLAHMVSIASVTASILKE